MPDRKKLSQYLRDLLTAQADATAAPRPERQEPMTIGPRTGVRDPAPQSGALAAIARSMAPSEDTPMGMVNEMFNPLRQGASARELAGKAVGAIQRRDMGKAAGLGALAAMSVPGVPGPDDAARMVPAARIDRVRDILGLRLVDIDTPEGVVRASLEQMKDGRINVRAIQRPNAEMETIDRAAQNTIGPALIRKLMREVQGMDWERPVTGWTGHRVTGAKPDHYFKGKP